MSWQARVWVPVLSAGLLVAAGGGLAVSSPQGKGARKLQKRGEQERFPHVHAAIRELHEAKKELERAAHDFGGHRVVALKACDHAIEQLQKALRFDQTH
jgi:hypothetical protein